MNFDGKFDVERFYEADGVRVAHERHDFDFDGRLDQLSFYREGELVRKELDTNFDNTIDTWLWCSGGWVVKAERDRQRDGRADVWESYTQGIMVEAEYDENNDGMITPKECLRAAGAKAGAKTGAKTGGTKQAQPASGSSQGGQTKPWWLQ